MALNNPLRRRPPEVLYDPLTVITLLTTSISLCLPALCDPSLTREQIYLSAENNLQRLSVGFD